MDILFVEIVRTSDIFFILGMIIIIITGSFSIGCITQQEQEEEKPSNDNTIFSCIAIFFFVILAVFGIFQEAKNPTGKEKEYLCVATDSMEAEDFMKYDVVKAHDGILILTEKSEK